MPAPPKKILCFASYFLPGFKSGGPVRSLLNLFSLLGRDFEFRVVTRNRDLGDSVPYPNRTVDRWFPEAGVQVKYLPSPYWAPGPMKQLLLECAPDLLYFNSFMDPALSIAPVLLRRLGLVGCDTPVLIAPRGEFSPGAIEIKRQKKVLYMKMARSLGVYRDVTWHATSELEREHLQSWWGADARIVLAPNLPPAITDAVMDRPPKEVGIVRMVFLSRIDRKKNLDGALRMLAGVKAKVHLDVYGTKEDAAYWDKCCDLMSGLPSNVTASYRGVLAPEEVMPTLSRYDLFFFPTLGENFGHVILEALLAGCPILISDQSPWRELPARHAGVDLPLNQVEEFRKAIETFAAMGADEFSRWVQGARDLGLEYCRGQDLVSPSRAMLELALGSPGRHA